MKISKLRMKRLFTVILHFFFNPHFLLCFGIAWFITNGWSYVGLALGTYFKWYWLIAVSSGYLALLWIPFTPEKIITLIIAIALLRLIFPHDKKTLAVLKRLKRRYSSKKQKSENSKK